MRYMPENKGIAGVVTVHLCNHALASSVVTLLLLLAIAFNIFRVRTTIFAPVARIAAKPCPLSTQLIVVVVGVAFSLGLLPAPPAFALARWRWAVALLWNLGAWPERRATCCTSPALHETVSAYESRGEHA